MNYDKCRRSTRSYANDIWPSGLLVAKANSAGVLDMSESEKPVDLGTASFAAKWMVSRGTGVLPSMARALNIFPWRLRVRRECTSLDVSCSAARMMMSVGVIAWRRRVSEGSQIQSHRILTVSCAMGSYTM